MTKPNKRKRVQHCLICNKHFTTYEWDSKIGKTKITVVQTFYCSKKCDKTMKDAIDGVMKWEIEHPIQDWFSWRWHEFKNLIRWYKLFPPEIPQRKPCKICDKK